MSSCSKAFITSRIINTSKNFALSIVFACIAGSTSQIVLAQKAPEATSARDFAMPMIEHAQKMRRYRDPDHDSQPTPRIIDRFRVDLDPHGAVASFQPNGATITSNNAFFKDMGANGRTCFTCHQPQNGWTITPGDVAERFERSRGTDPIFRLVDGATCPSDDVSSIRAKRKAYGLLLDKGLIRIGLAIPATAEFVLTSVNDPYKCSNNAAIGTTGILSMYRRPLPTTNVSFSEHDHVGWPRRRRRHLRGPGAILILQIRLAMRPSFMRKRQLHPRTLNWLRSSPSKRAFSPPRSSIRKPNFSPMIMPKAVLARSHSRNSLSASTIRLGSTPKESEVHLADL